MSVDLSEVNGLILVNKDKGMTSFGVDQRLKRLLKTKKIGHLGTLDPFATGLLPLCIGKGLRFVRFADNYDKAYRCLASFGKATDTYDIDGEVIGGRMPTLEEMKELRDSDYKMIREAFEDMKNIKSQIPPRYSAKKINGKRACDLTRSGIEIEMRPHSVSIYRIDIISIEEVDESFEVLFDVYCSKGTYIRTICDDIGRNVGFGAYAKELERIEVGNYELSSAYRLEDIEKMIDEDDYSFVIDAASIASYMPSIELNKEQVAMVRNGKRLDSSCFDETEHIDDGVYIRAMYGNDLIAVLYNTYVDDHRVLKIERMLA